MNRVEIRQWLIREFEPVKLATPIVVIDQIIETAIRYWNTHSGHRIVHMYPVSSPVSAITPSGLGPVMPGAKRIQVSSEFKSVCEVYPASSNMFLFASHPMWTLLGVTIIDNITSDLILLGEGFKSYRYYIGNDFKFHFEPSQNPEVGGYLYLVNLPLGTSRIAVIGTKRISSVFSPAKVVSVRKSISTSKNYCIDIYISGERKSVSLANGMSMSDLSNSINSLFNKNVSSVNSDGYLSLYSDTSGYSSYVNVFDTEGYDSGGTSYLFGNSPVLVYGVGDYDIVNEYILEWLLQYSKALLKIKEGELLRKADIIGVKSDGSSYVDEGNKEKDELEKRLAAEGRWVSLVSLA